MKWPVSWTCKGCASSNGAIPISSGILSTYLAEEKSGKMVYTYTITPSDIERFVKEICVEKWMKIPYNYLG